MENKAVIIGIAGGSASGKTSIAQSIYDRFKGSHRVKIIKQDDYYKDQSDKTMEERVKTNYDHPFAFDNDLLVSDLKKLKKKERIEKPTYDYSKHTRSDITEVIEDRDVIILEGIFVLAEEEVRNLCDILIYVDTDADIRFIRRLRRDVEERARTVDSVCNQYLETVRRFKGSHRVKIIKQDDYYKDQSDKTMEERVKTNYDHPFAFDNDLLVSDLKKLKKKERIEKPTYDYSKHTRSDITEVIEDRDVIILEGIFVLAEEEVRDLCDILIYVDTDADIRFIRRLRRDVEERARTVDSVCNQYLETVRPMHEQFIEPSKKYAHIIIPEGGTNTVAIDLLITKISSILGD